MLELDRLELSIRTHLTDSHFQQPSNRISEFGLRTLIRLSKNFAKPQRLVVLKWIGRRVTNTSLVASKRKARRRTHRAVGKRARLLPSTSVDTIAISYNILSRQIITAKNIHISGRQPRSGRHVYSWLFSSAAQAERHIPVAHRNTPTAFWKSAQPIQTFGIAIHHATLELRKVLECASPLALFRSAWTATGVQCRRSL